MKKKRLTGVLVLALLFSAVVVVLPAQAEARTIVVPDDYSTIRAAVNAASAGDTVFVRKGVYNETTLEISKPLSLIGEDALTTWIKLNPPWIEYENAIPFDWSKIPHYDNAVKIEANDVTLSGFTIISNVTGVGGGCIAIGDRIQVIGNRLLSIGFTLIGSLQVFAINTLTSTLWCSSSGYKTIAGNRIVGGSIVMGTEEGTTPNTQIGAFIYGNTVTDSNSESVSYGIRIDGGANAVFNNTVVNCTHAVSLLGESSSNNIFANTIINNVEGLELFGQGSNNTFHGNYVANNQYGVLVSHTYLRTPGENNTVYRNNFFGNTEQVNTGTTYPGYYDSPVSTFHTGNFDNGEEGNYWSDYNGEDANSDGVGDTSYVIDASRQDNFPLMAPFDISSVSIELPEWAYALPYPLPSPLPLPTSETMSADSAKDVSPPEIEVLSPTNQVYNESCVALVFTVNEQCNWTGYSLDGEENMTVTGNFTLTDLPNGSHNVTVYANDTQGNMGASETTKFTIAVPEPTPEPFPTVPIATASAASIIAVGAGLLVYFKKCKH